MGAHSLLCFCSVTGGELFDAIIERGRFQEDEARKCFAAVVRAVEYMHGNGIAHRDLKPENILLRDRADVTSIKISDFGLAKVNSESDVMKTICGTPQYLAPEVLLAQRTHGTYGKECDMWSLGVILYILYAVVIRRYRWHVLTHCCAVSVVASRSLIAKECPFTNKLQRVSSPSHPKPGKLFPMMVLSCRALPRSDPCFCSSRLDQTVVNRRPAAPAVSIGSTEASMVGTAYTIGL